MAQASDSTWKRYKEAIQAQEVQASELNIRRSALQDQIHSMEADTRALRVSSLAIQAERTDKMATLVALQDNLASTYVSVQNVQDAVQDMAVALKRAQASKELTAQDLKDFEKVSAAELRAAACSV